MKTINRKAMLVMVAVLALVSVPMFASGRGTMEMSGEMTLENPFGWTRATQRLEPAIYQRFLSAAAGEESRVGGERIRYSSAIPDGAQVPEPAVYDSPRIGMSSHPAPMVVSSPADPRLLALTDAHR